MTGAMGAGLQPLVFMVCLLMAFSKHITPVEQPRDTLPRPPEMQSRGGCGFHPFWGYKDPDKSVEIAPSCGRIPP
jgi:hypothetical protein